MSLDLPLGVDPHDAARFRPSGGRSSAFEPKQWCHRLLFLLLLLLIAGGAVAAGASGQPAQGESAYEQYDNSDCLDCHGDEELEADTERGEKLDLHVDEDVLLSLVGLDEAPTLHPTEPLDGSCGLVVRHVVLDLLLVR